MSDSGNSLAIPIIQVDAFASAVFGGNPAAVCPLLDWLPDGVLQAIARENNLSETAFIVPSTEGYQLRWFTPTLEVNLCGHATLAAAWVIFNQIRPESNAAEFFTKSGRLSVLRDGDMMTMDFPAVPSRPGGRDERLAALLGNAKPVEFHTIPKQHGAEYRMLVYESVADVVALTPQFSALDINVIATARTQDAPDGVDFVSRFFAPASGVNEDPVTGSAHCTLAPYWASSLGCNELKAAQLSQRGGIVLCAVEGDRVKLAGTCVLYMQGSIFVPTGESSSAAH